MDRREFLALTGLGVAGTPASLVATGTPEAAWDPEIAQSPDYVLVQEAPAVDWVHIWAIVKPKPAFRVELMAWETYPEESVDVVIPVATGKWPGLLIQSPVGYETLVDYEPRLMSIVRPKCEARPGPLFFFDETVSLRAYANKKAWDVRILAQRAGIR